MYVVRHSEREDFMMSDQEWIKKSKIDSKPLYDPSITDNGVLLASKIAKYIYDEDRKKRISRKNKVYEDTDVKKIDIDSIGEDGDELFDVPNGSKKKMSIKGGDIIEYDMKKGDNMTKNVVAGGITIKNDTGGITIKNNTNTEMLPNHIYVSPLTRCIETGIVFQSYISKKYGKLSPLRVEYGLFYDQHYGDRIQWITNKITSDGKSFSLKNNIVDVFDKDYYTAYEISKRFAGAIFDIVYQPYCSMSEIMTEVSYKKSIDNRVRTFRKIKKFDSNCLCVTHAENLGILKSLMDKKWRYQNIDLFSGMRFCSWLYYE